MWFGQTKLKLKILLKHAHKAIAFCFSICPLCRVRSYLSRARFVNFLSSVIEFELFTSLAPQHTHRTNETSTAKSLMRKQNTSVRVSFGYLFFFCCSEFVDIHFLHFMWYTVRCEVVIRLFSFISTDSVRELVYDCRWCAAEWTGGRTNLCSARPIYVINTKTALHWLSWVHFEVHIERAFSRQLSKHFWAVFYSISITIADGICVFIKLCDRMKPKNRSNETEFPFRRDDGSHALFRSRRSTRKITLAAKSFNWYATSSPLSSSSAQSFAFSNLYFHFYIIYVANSMCDPKMRPNRCYRIDDTVFALEASSHLRASSMFVRQIN